jgi:hypothetical protein
MLKTLHTNHPILLVNGNINEKKINKNKDLEILGGQIKLMNLKGNGSKKPIKFIF